MNNFATLTLAGAVCALMLVSANPARAANKPATSVAKATAARSAAMRSAWPPETLSGKITMVNPDRKLLVVDGPDQVPFDMVVTAKTHITYDGRAVPLKSLTRYQNQPVSIQFVPERRGDVAESIRIGA